MGGKVFNANYIKYNIKLKKSQPYINAGNKELASRLRPWGMIQNHIDKKTSMRQYRK